MSFLQSERFTKLYRMIFMLISGLVVLGLVQQALQQRRHLRLVLGGLRGQLLLRTQSGDPVRQYKVYVPPASTVSRRPLIVVLHGHTQRMEDMTGESGRAAPNREWLTIADEQSVLVAIPQGPIGLDGMTGWEDCRSDNRWKTQFGDAEALLAMVDAIDREFAIDRNLICWVGISNGGFMAQRMALEHPQRVAAVAAIISAVPVFSMCQPLGVPVPILMINGTNDKVVPSLGGTIAGDRGRIYSNLESVAFWQKYNRASEHPEVISLENHSEEDLSNVRLLRYNGEAPVLYYEVLGGGHVEPSRKHRYGQTVQAILGRQNHDIETARECWAFFQGVLPDLAVSQREYLRIQP